MHTDLEVYYQLLLRSYRRYLEAERRVSSAREGLREVFPVREIPYHGTIGAPGSRFRRLYDERASALFRLQSAHEKFRAAQRRVERRNASTCDVFLIGWQKD
ncbi:hypothetical protein [Pseudaestuariivita atlantica]|uniref:Uncharacterized protein n=1 Tax=Pseudaestuariivita atlantica TaxID=1317121 RepID=A0A0L1JN82_9RHOB|nr:hypothetical protein [Pseudaestuariivita atlantica]KNG93167.1 hypothetical protein ATO11_14485 [Pseudaestuariivita atlantica]